MYYKRTGVIARDSAYGHSESEAPQAGGTGKEPGSYAAWTCGRGHILMAFEKRSQLWANILFASRPGALWFPKLPVGCPQTHTSSLVLVHWGKFNHPQRPCLMDRGESRVTCHAQSPLLAPEHPTCLCGSQTARLRSSRLPSVPRATHAGQHGNKSHPPSLSGIILHSNISPSQPDRR